MRRVTLMLTIGMALALTGSHAAADGPVQVTPIDFEFQAENPCTGEAVTVHYTGIDRVHSFYNAAGDVHHFNVSSVVTVETSDGFFGHDSFVTVHNAEGPFGPREDEDRGMEMQNETGVARNPDTGEVIRIHFLSLLVYVSETENVVERTALAVECLGISA